MKVAPGKIQAKRRQFSKFSQRVERKVFIDTDTFITQHFVCAVVYSTNAKENRGQKSHLIEGEKLYL
jgi:hypothetical protein